MEIRNTLTTHISISYIQHRTYQLPLLRKIQQTNRSNQVMEYRIEKDTMGEVKVPVDAYYGAQTQRSIENFKIAQDINRMPKEIIAAFAYLKKAAAITNCQLGVLPQEKSD